MGADTMYLFIYLLPFSPWQPEADYTIPLSPILPYNSPVRKVNLRECKWSKITQYTSMADGGFEYGSPGS